MEESTTPLLHDNIYDDECLQEASNRDKSSDSNSNVIKQSFSSSVSEESETLQQKNEQYDTYWYRWYICIIFSMLGLLQGAIWNTWGPINDSAEISYGFTEHDIELLTNWGPISFIIFMPIFMWVLDNKGLRLAGVSTAFLVALGTGLRCLPLDVSVLRYVIHVGQFLNGIGGCVVMAAPPMLSNTWFPLRERITATGVITLFNYLGTGVGYIVGLVVSDPSNSTKNISEDCLHVIPKDSNGTCHDVIFIRDQIKTILYIEFGLSVFVFISMLLFFPSRPPLPPSVSAAIPRVGLKTGLKQLAHHKQYWVVTTVMALVIGTWSSWTGVMPIIIKPLGIDQNQAGLIGFLMSVVGCFVGMLVGWLTDRLRGRMKLMLTLLFSICIILFLYFIIIANKWLNFVPFLPQPAEIWTVCILLGTLMNAAVPIGMEMAADAGYPICEGTSTSIVVWLFNVFSFVFLLLLGLAPDPLIANYIMFGCVCIGVPMLIFFTKEQNRRLQLDIQITIDGTKHEDGYGTFSDESAS